MIAKTNEAFWAGFENLPQGVQALAREKYALWRADPFHPSLHFKQVAPGLWSVRIGRNYRALARRRGEMVVWFWIGPHVAYDRLIGSWD